jgi:hypothetical protein
MASASDDPALRYSIIPILQANGRICDSATPAALTAKAGPRRSSPKRYHGSIGRRCWLPPAVPC